MCTAICERGTQSIVTKIMKEKQIYLTGLNGLRAIAALSVVVAHISQEGIADFGFPRLFDLPMAGYGVTLFFVISGFLITYLLINEIKKTKTVNVTKFYIRRILRIWPIYYLFILVAILVLTFLMQSQPILVPELWYYIFFAANFPFIAQNGILILVHYWSIGVEEQFYLFWPWVARFSKTKLLKVAVLILILLFAAKIAAWFVWGAPSFVYRFFMVTRFHCMMIGAISAILFASQNQLFIRIFTHKFTQALAWFLFFIMGFGLIHVPAVIGQEVIAVVSVSMILGQVINERRLFNLERPVFDFVGKISYGIYVIHPLIVLLLSRLFKPLEMNMFLKYVLVYSSVIASTILLSWLSYKYFEKPFLNLKTKYMVVKSSNSMLTKS